MTLAIEKDSPASASTIFWNNLIVVVRFTLSFGALLWAFYLIQLEETPVKLIILATLILWVGSFRFGRDIEVGLILRRLRYKGYLTWTRIPPSENNKNPRWFCSVPGWGVAKVFRDQLADISDTVLKNLDEYDAYVQFAVGKNDAGEYIVKKVHSCDNDPAGCDKPAIHLFGYNEEKDGRIWWGN